MGAAQRRPERAYSSDPKARPGLGIGLARQATGYGEEASGSVGDRLAAILRQNAQASADEEPHVVRFRLPHEEGTVHLGHGGSANATPLASGVAGALVNRVPRSPPLQADDDDDWTCKICGQKANSEPICRTCGRMQGMTFHRTFQTSDEIAQSVFDEIASASGGRGGFFAGGQGRGRGGTAAAGATAPPKTVALPRVAPSPPPVQSVRKQGYQQNASSMAGSGAMMPLKPIPLQLLPPKPPLPEALPGLVVRFEEPRSQQPEQPPLPQQLRSPPQEQLLPQQHSGQAARPMVGSPERGILRQQPLPTQLPAQLEPRHGSGSRRQRATLPASDYSPHRRSSGGLAGPGGLSHSDSGFLPASSSSPYSATYPAGGAVASGAHATADRAGGSKPAAHDDEFLRPRDTWCGRPGDRQPPSSPPVAQARRSHQARAASLPGDRHQHGEWVHGIAALRELLPPSPTQGRGTSAALGDGGGSSGSGAVAVPLPPEPMVKAAAAAPPPPPPPPPQQPFSPRGAPHFLSASGHGAAIAASVSSGGFGAAEAAGPSLPGVAAGRGGQPGHSDQLGTSSRDQLSPSPPPQQQRPQQRPSPAAGKQPAPQQPLPQQQPLQAQPPQPQHAAAHHAAPAGDSAGSAPVVSKAATAAASSAAAASPSPLASPGPGSIPPRPSAAAPGQAGGGARRRPAAGGLGGTGGASGAAVPSSSEVARSGGTVGRSGRGGSIGGAASGSPSVDALETQAALNAQLEKLARMQGRLQKALLA